MPERFIAHCCGLMMVSQVASGVLAAAALPALVPKPAALELRPGVFELNAKTAIYAGAPSASEVQQLAASLKVAAGIDLSLASAGQMTNGISLSLDESLPTRLGAEGYRLKVTPDGIAIVAGGPAGLFYGGVTLCQLVSSEGLGAHGVAGPQNWQVPCLMIEDFPRFAWRGLLLDVARHYFPEDLLRKLIDLMAQQKMNRLQLHLTDDQGWRLEIKKYPRLTEIGAFRKESPKARDPKTGDGTPYGPFFYTQTQMRELVAYAAQRQVTLVPEIEIPGHFGAALAAYPQFSCTGGPFEVRTRWGIEPDILCVGNEAAITFAQDVLAEVTQVFPSQFIHIGGDEAPRARWQKCPKCQALQRAQGFKTEAELQSYLNRRLEQFLAGRGRRLIGWDEILEGGLAPGAAVMSWRGVTGGITAANAGHDVVMSPTTHCYFDYAQAQGPGEPESIGGFIPLDKVYAFDPMPKELPLEKQRHILGIQGNIWTEFIRTPRQVEYFAFPRSVALAEVAWSPPGARTYPEFLTRLKAYCRLLDRLQVNYRHPD